MRSNNNGITGIVLSGGKSTRMGQDKGRMLLAGQPLILYSIRILEKLGCPILISSNNPGDVEFGYPVVEDTVTGIGPLGGIYSSLQASETEMNIVLSCDIPLVPYEVVRFLLEESANHQAVIPVFLGHPEPLCGIYRKETIETIREMIARKSYKMQTLLKLIRTRYLEITPDAPFFHEKMFTNVNHPDELLKVARWLKG